MLKTLPLPYYQAMKPKTIDDVFSSPTCSIAKFKAEVGETKARALVVYILADVVQNLNVGKTMNDLQIARTADLILDEFFYLKPEDFKLCFDRALMGKYGVAFDRLDTQIVFSWLYKYCGDRAEKADDSSYQDHVRCKETKKIDEHPLRNIYIKTK